MNQGDEDAARFYGGTWSRGNGKVLEFASIARHTFVYVSSLHVCLVLASTIDNREYILNCLSNSVSDQSERFPSSHGC